MGGWAGGGLHAQGACIGEYGWGKGAAGAGVGAWEAAFSVSVWLAGGLPRVTIGVRGVGGSDSVAIVAVAPMRYKRTFNTTCLRCASPNIVHIIYLYRPLP